MTKDGMGQTSRLMGSHKKARQSRSLPVMEKPPRETPYQDYHRIKRMVQSKADLKGELSTSDLFIDASFPPDRSSLTYVYSGDDKYERAVFRRPKEVRDEFTLNGVGGICDEPFPWQQWKQRGWFQAALVVVSLNVRALERLIPGFRKNEQNFGAAYVGCFHFHIWRFGEWVNIVVDDYLPMLGDLPLFSRPLGSACEMWGPLVEKAYAKCKKTFQAIEYGFTLDALTDLTGAVCEFYTPDVDPPSNLFHIIYKSGTNRSFMTCWRNNKRLTPAGFNWLDEQGSSDIQRYLHIITAVTKFSVSGGRMDQMIRLKCPYVSEPKWHGRFADGDTASWQNINSEFMSRLQPDVKKDPDEYWMTFSDFRCNFGGLFIISSPEPFRLDGLNMPRTYRTRSDVGLQHADLWAERAYRNRGRRSTTPNETSHREFGKRRTNSDSDCHSSFFIDSLSAPCSPHRIDRNRPSSSDAAIRRRLFIAKGKERESRPSSCKGFSRSSNKSKTVDNESAFTEHNRQASCDEQQEENNEDGSSTASRTLSSSCLPSPRRRKSAGEKLREHVPVGVALSCDVQGVTSAHALKKTARSNFMKKHSLDTSLHGLAFSPYYSGSIDTATDFTLSVTESPVWATPVQQEAASSSSTSPPDSSKSISSGAEQMSPDSSVRSPTTPRPGSADPSKTSLYFDSLSKLKSESNRRPQSAPDKYSVARETSAGSLNSLTQSFFLATKADYFSSQGRWKVILEHKDAWGKNTPTSDRTRLDVHSKTQRVYFLVTRMEQRDPLLPPTLQDKRHVLVSLIQDYRHGPSTANSLLVPVGFCLYKTKHNDRDEKRHISKLQLIGQIDGQPDKREVTARFDLEPGGYFLVPYYQADHHEGEYLLRVLTDSDVESVKGGCKIS